MDTFKSNKLFILPGPSNTNVYVYVILRKSVRNCILVTTHTHTKTVISPQNNQSSSVKQVTRDQFYKCANEGIGIKYRAIVHTRNLCGRVMLHVPYGRVCLFYMGKEWCIFSLKKREYSGLAHVILGSMNWFSLT